MKKVSASPIEQILYNRIMDIAADLEDGETGTAKCVDLACERLGLSDEIAQWACNIAFTESALEAGIPLAVIEGKSKLPDVEDEEEECEHWEVEDMHCLDCGEDRSEHIMSRAYDYYKDKMKYGE